MGGVDRAGPSCGRSTSTAVVVGGEEEGGGWGGAVSPPAWRGSARICL